MQEFASSVAGVKASSEYINGRVFLQIDNRVMNLSLRGVNPQTEFKVSKVKD